MPDKRHSPKPNRDGVEHLGMTFFDLPAAEYDSFKFAMQEEDRWNFVSNTKEIHLDFIKGWAPRWNTWAQRLAHPKGSIHLDIGAGIGGLSYLVARQKYHSIAIELDGTNLAGGIHLTRLLPVMEHQSLQLWVANICDIPLPDDSVDFITIKEVLHHLPNPTALLREISRILKPDGLLYIWEPFWPSQLISPFRWLVVEKFLRPRELALGVHHVYYSFRDYRRIFEKAASQFEMDPFWKRGKWYHHLTQNRLCFGAVEAVLELTKPAPNEFPQRRTILPNDFVNLEYLPVSLQASEQYASYFASLAIGDNQ